jgi:hypothetical protein
MPRSAAIGNVVIFDDIGGWASLEHLVSSLFLERQGETTLHRNPTSGLTRTGSIDNDKPAAALGSPGTRASRT